MEAFTLGVLTAFFDNVIVLQALCVLHHFSLVKFINYLQPDHPRGLPRFDTFHTSIKGRCFSFNQYNYIQRLLAVRFLWSWTLAIRRPHGFGYAVLITTRA